MALIVADSWQNLGLGGMLVDHIIEISRDRKLETIYTRMFPDNHNAIRLAKTKGFAIEPSQDGTVRGIRDLRS